MGWGSEHSFFARWLLQLPQLPSWRGGYRGREAKCHGDKEPCDCVPLVDGDIASVHYCCLMLRSYTQSATPRNEVISYTHESIGICHCWYDKSPGVLLDDGAAHGTVWVGFGWMYHGTIGATGTAQRHFVVFCVFSTHESVFQHGGNVLSVGNGGNVGEISKEMQLKTGLIWRSEKTRQL